MYRRSWIATAIITALPVGLLAAPASAQTDPQFPTGAYYVQGVPTGYLTGEPGNLERRIYVNNSWMDDNLTYDKDLKHVFFAGDGSPGVPWAFEEHRGATLVYSYRTTGTFHPYVELTDEDGNTSTIYPHSYLSIDPVTITVLRDEVAPRVAVRIPGPPRRHSVAAWRVIRGTAADDESGLDHVLMHVLQRRSGRWFVYDFFTHRWYRGSASYAWTYQHLARYRGYPYPNPTGVWDTRPIRAMTKGRLVVQVEARDRAGHITRARPVDVVLFRR